MRVRLIPLDGGSPVEILKDLSVVGRKEDCDIRLDHKSVSKQHCVIVKTDGLLLLRDLGSTNGTRVNGQRVRRAALLPNDQLHIATLRYKVQFHTEEVAPVAPGEYTQQMDLEEADRLHSQRSLNSDEDSVEMDLPPIQANALPDVYPENPSRGG